MNDDSPGARDPGKNMEVMQELTRLWTTSQAAISAYITAHVSDRHHAEDLVQEVGQSVAEKFHEFDRERSFTAWALGFARNRVLKYYRSQSRDRLVLSDVAMERLATAFDPLESSAEQRRDALRKCLSRIQGRRKQVVNLRYREDVKVADIAAEFSTSPSAISVMLFRVRKTLLECVNQQLKASEP